MERLKGFECCSNFRLLWTYTPSQDAIVTTMMTLLFSTEGHQSAVFSTHLMCILYSMF